MLISLNFKHLRPSDPDLAHLGAVAEKLLHLDPNTSIIKIRQFGELLFEEIMYEFYLYPAFRETQDRRLRRVSDLNLLDPRVIDAFHLLRKKGNDATHKHSGSYADASMVLKKAWGLGCWFHRSFIDDTFVRVAFQMPQKESSNRSIELCKITDLGKRINLLTKKITLLMDRLKRSRSNSERIYFQALILDKQSYLAKLLSVYYLKLSKHKAFESQRVAERLEHRKGKGNSQQKNLVKCW